MSNVAIKEISICNDALALIGYTAIHDFDGRTPASETCKRLYALVLGQLLDSYPWRFAMKQERLTRLADAPDVEYKYAYKLPVGRDGQPYRLYSDAHGAPIVYSAIFGDSLHCDAEAVYCDYVRLGGLTGSFRNLLVRALAADLSISLADDRGLHDRLFAAAFGSARDGGHGGLWRTAVSNDTNGAPVRHAIRIGDGPLVEAFRS